MNVLFLSMVDGIALRSGSPTITDIKVPQSYLHSYTIQYISIFPMNVVRWESIKILAE